jgi:hypothetical protein
MYVYELMLPGTWLDGLDAAVARDAEGLLRLMANGVDDAAIALTLFDSVHGNAVARSSGREGWEEDRAREAAIRNRLAAALPVGLTTEQRWVAEQRLSEAARVEAKRQKWSEGNWPDSYQHRIPFLHAKTFVYALDGIAKALKQLRRLVGIPDLSTIAASWDQAFPQLVHVRDSAHHAEDRVRGKGKHDKPLPNVPVLTPAIHAPNGGVVVMDMLTNNRYGGTLADGSYGEVEVSPESLAAAGGVVQQAALAFQWKGPEDHRPR